MQPPPDISLFLVYLPVVRDYLPGAEPGRLPPGGYLSCGNSTRLPSDLLEVFSRVTAEPHFPQHLCPKASNGT